MSTKPTPLQDSYLPVPWESREVIEEEIEKKTHGKIFFFNNESQIDEEKGTIVSITEEKSSGVFILLDTGAKIRIDRIITLFGKVSAAYDEYDAFANACMNCTGGAEGDQVDGSKG